VSILTLFDASGKRKTPQMRSHKLRRMFAEVRPNFGRIVTCCRAEPSRTFGRILRPNFGVCRSSAHLYCLEAVWAQGKASVSAFRKRRGVIKHLGCFSCFKKTWKNCKVHIIHIFGKIGKISKIV